MATKPQDQPLRGAGLERLHIWQIQVVRDVMLVAALVGLVWLGYALRAVTVPLLVALLLAYLFEPIVARFSRHPNSSRPMVVGGLLATVGIVVIALVAVLIPLAVGQTARLVQDYNSGQFRQTAIKVTGYMPAALQIGRAACRERV